MKVIHIAERDTQTATYAKQPGEFVNTWSIDGFVGEGCQPAELGWGTHEKTLPADGRRHDFGGDAAIYLMRPGASTRVRTWTPMAGPLHGFLITHNESISIADYYSVMAPAMRLMAGRCVIGRRCIMRIIRATTRCCRCMNWRGGTGSSSRSSG